MPRPLHLISKPYSPDRRHHHVHRQTPLSSLRAHHLSPPFERENLSILGVYFRPAKPQSPVAVLLGRSFGTTYHSLENYTGAFDRAGIAAKVFSFCSGSPYSKEADV